MLTFIKRNKTVQKEEYEVKIFKTFCAEGVQQILHKWWMNTDVEWSCQHRPKYLYSNLQILGLNSTCFITKSTALEKLGSKSRFNIKVVQFKMDFQTVFVKTK